MEKIENIAKWFINEISPDPLKLQKLLYFAQGISFCFNDEELFDEELEAWVHGPVNSNIYFKYREYIYNPINLKYQIPNFSQKTLQVLEFVRDNYGKYDSKYLEEITHNQFPWQFAREGLDPDERDNKIIPKEVIAEYFVSLMLQPNSEEWDK